MQVTSVSHIGPIPAAAIATLPSVYLRTATYNKTDIVTLWLNWTTCICEVQLFANYLSRISCKTIITYCAPYAIEQNFQPPRHC